jgi:hypothetical protein
VPASSDVAIDGGGPSGDCVSAGRNHGEELAAFGDAASGHGEPLFECGSERLPECLGIGTGQAKGSGEGVPGRSGGGPIIGSRKAGGQFGHEMELVAGRDGEKVLEGATRGRRVVLRDWFRC